jgi:ornithine--oxo-acid transaminase
MEFQYVSAKTKELLELDNRYCAGGLDPLPAFMSRAKGVKLWVPYSTLRSPGNDTLLTNVQDVDGKEYLDFVCMFGAVNQGHSHPKIVDAVVKQVQEGI